MKKIFLALIIFISLAANANAQFASGTVNARQLGTWTVTGAGGTFPATQSGAWTVQPGNTANTTPWLVTFGGNSTVFNAQLAVTASAQTLATNTSKNVCVKALSANTLNIYVGVATVTTANGMELTPGDSICLPVSNSNLLQVIASSTGSSVSYIGTN